AVIVADLFETKSINIAHAGTHLGDHLKVVGFYQIAVKTLGQLLDLPSVGGEVEVGVPTEAIGPYRGGIQGNLDSLVLHFPGVDDPGTVSRGDGNGQGENLVLGH